ncbi:MAG TPA: hypothetical protein VIU64_03465, partial [Polyangia bacterium]
DGTKDRVIDWYIPGSGAETGPRKALPAPKSVAPRAGAPASTTGSTKPRPPGRPKDVEAITDL